MLCGYSRHALYCSKVTIHNYFLDRRTHVLENLRQLPPAPSVQLQDVPRENLGDHLGVWQKNEREAQDELDLTIARSFSYLLHYLRLLG